MGWLWSSSKPTVDPPQQPPTPFADSADPPPLSSSDFAAEPPSSSAAFDPPPPSTSPASDPTEALETSSSPQTKQKQKQYEYADAEFRAFFREIAAEEAAALPHNQLFHNSPLKKLFGGRSKAPPAAAAETQSLDDDNTNNSNLTDISEPPSPTPSPQTLKIATPNLYPTTISCRSAFDQAFYCQSLGGQFNAVYHYGGIRNCGHLWSQFWFCIRTNRRPMSDEDRKKRIMEYYQARERKYQEGPSSEDVWTQRKEMVVGAFGRDYDELIAAREEMRKLKWRDERGLGWVGLRRRDGGGDGGGDGAGAGDEGGVVGAVEAADEEEEKGRRMWKERIERRGTETGAQEQEQKEKGSQS